MAGWITNGMVRVGPATVNGVAQTVPQGTIPQAGSTARMAADTPTSSGQEPVTYAVPLSMIASIACAMVQNKQTSTVHAATSNTFSGYIVTEALTIAAAATYTFTLTNSLVAATAVANTSYSNIDVDIRSGTNTVPGLTLTSVTAGAGSSVWVFTNLGTAAINGTMVIAWHLY